MAVALGVVNVERDILGDLTMKQLRLWKQYSLMEPFDQTRADYRAASIVQAVLNVNRGPKDKSVKIEDVVLKFGAQEQPQKRKQSLTEQWNILKLLAVAHSNKPR